MNGCKVPYSNDPAPFYPSAPGRPTVPGGWSGLNNINDPELLEYFKGLKTQIEDYMNAEYLILEPILYS